ncbi:MAG: YdiU family protein [Proteobacteria bacterium]|nr:YdiU family protein [Pseudomonadota bacterium]HQR05082.1 YdiU family protein [Rhodocyclaceae bacterium]
MTAPRPFAFDNSYARDLEGLYVRWQAAHAPRPTPIRVNAALAGELGVSPEALMDEQGLAMLAGNVVPAGAEPLAQAYAGHQFGGFSPRLGDGRALLLGEVIDRQGQRRDIAFKGSGRTPFSRNGDGKCALGPALREYLMGEAMAAFGIPTTRALAVVATGDTVLRERPLPGVVLTRVAASHLRVGTFEYAATHLGAEGVRRLAGYTLARHYPELNGEPEPCLALLKALIDRQATLVARWMGVGFIHGVMNTDNMTLSGETIDYGPCAFMEAYDPATVFSSIDHHGRYAYGNQPSIAQWNLARFAETLLGLIDADENRAVERASAAIHDFVDVFEARWSEVFGAKLGLDGSGDAAADRALIEDFLGLLKARKLDFTLAFRALYDVAAGDAKAPQQLFTVDDTGWIEWRRRWMARQPQRSPALLAAMSHANPWLIPRNYRVEEALEAAVDRGDLAPFDRLLAALQAPSQVRSGFAMYATPAPAEITARYQTFCGT